MWHRLRNEPALIFSLVEATVALAVAFGLNLTAEQTGAVLAIVAILTGVTVRQQVYGPVTADELVDAASHADDWAVRAERANG